MKFQYREASSPKSKGKKLDHIRVRQADGGGHVVEHHFSEDGMAYHKPATHVFGEDEGAEMLAHVSKHMKVKAGEAKEEAEEGE